MDKPTWRDWELEDIVEHSNDSITYKAKKLEAGQICRSNIYILTIPGESLRKKAVEKFGNHEPEVQNYYKSIVSDIEKGISALDPVSHTLNIAGCKEYEVIREERSGAWKIFMRADYAVPLSEYMLSDYITLKDIVLMGVDICSALCKCAEKGIFHGNINHTSILLSDHKDFMLSGFDLYIKNKLPEENKFYAAPEVLKKGEYSLLSDLYSLGIVLYSLLNNGRKPFLPSFPQKISFSDNRSSLQKRLSGEEIPLPANTDEQIGAIILKACAFDPIGRYQSPLEMKEALEGYLASKNILLRMQLHIPVGKDTEEDSYDLPLGTIEPQFQNTAPEKNTGNIKAGNIAYPIVRSRKKPLKILVALVITACIVFSLFAFAHKSRTTDPDSITNQNPTSTPQQTFENTPSDEPAVMEVESSPMPAFPPSAAPSVVSTRKPTTAPTMTPPAEPDPSPALPKSPAVQDDHHQQTEKPKPQNAPAKPKPVPTPGRKSPIVPTTTPQTKPAAAPTSSWDNVSKPF